MNKHRIRAALPADLDAIIALMPRLAAFDIPADRNPEHLWHEDAEIARQWAAGEADHCFIQVAEDADGELSGLVMVTLRPELLSHEPSAHIEALAVAQSAEGAGLGSALIDAAEAEARARGAESMTLHVFECNGRARAVYERRGYYGELIRYRKPL